MATILESFERCCRLCAEEQDVTIMIFSKEAEAMLLQNKLNKYLLIEVDEDDKLPKNICIKCCSKLQTVCDFIDTARKAQDILHNQSIILEQTETVSLTQEINIKQDYDDAIKSTAIEVNVDPSMVLEISDDLDIEENEDDLNSQEQDVSYLHGVDGEDVTIKLIKKGSKCDSIVKPFQCFKCNRGFSSDIALKSHSWTHSYEERGLKQYKCSCGEEFDYKNDYLQHIKRHKIKGMCNVCGRVFKTEENLAQHMAAHTSSTPRSYVCKVCNRSYNTSSNLKTHSVTHSNERPYKCPYCKKCFKRNQDLKFHINQHTGAKPYKCPFCEKSFASSGNCYSHKSRMHADACSKVDLKKRRAAFARKNKFLPSRTFATIKSSAKYQCTVCDHSFLNRDNYTYHMYQHTGEKPFQCSFCDEKFVTRNGLSLHHDKSHPGKERPLALVSKNALLQ